MSTSDPTSTADFPAADRQQWRRLVAGVLRRTGALRTEGEPGPEVERLLASADHDGLDIAPLYTAEDLPGPAAPVPGVRGATGWDVRQLHTDPDPARAAETVLADLENGVGSLWLRLETGDGDGLAAAALETVLAGVYLDLAPVVLEAGPRSAAAAEQLLRLAEARGVPAEQLAGNLGFDPLGWQARTGQAPDFSGLTRLAGRCATDHPALRAVTVDALPYHGAGGSEAEELGCALATGVAYLRALTDAGLDVADAFAQLEFRFAASADQFATIAKLRAARLLWARTAESCGTSATQRQHAVTSEPMLTAYDPWVNMLRTTVAGFAAGVAGADAVTVLPFDSRLGLPDAFARRIARNTQTLLVEEAHLARVADPAAGSWYVEHRTGQLAAAGWDWFTRIERAGGMERALADGVVADRLAETWRRRRTEIAHRRDPVTGVSEFPDLSERRLERRAAPPRPTGGLPVVWYAQDFEGLRDRSRAHAETTGQPPTVALVTVGAARAVPSAAATFAANLLAAGGITVTQPSGPAAAVPPTPVVCLDGLGADQDQVEQAVKALLAAGAVRVWQLGPPDPGSEPGVQRLFRGCDAVAALTHILADLGVA